MRWAARAYAPRSYDADRAGVVGVIGTGDGTGTTPGVGVMGTGVPPPGGDGGVDGPGGGRTIGGVTVPGGNGVVGVGGLPAGGAGEGFTMGGTTPGGDGGVDGSDGGRTIGGVTGGCTGDGGGTPPPPGGVGDGMGDGEGTGICTHGNVAGWGGVGLGFVRGSCCCSLVG